MWTVFRVPVASLGTRFLARRFEIQEDGAKPTNETVTGATLGDVRRQLPFGLVMLARAPEDQPSVVESWV